MDDLGNSGSRFGLGNEKDFSEFLSPKIGKNDSGGDLPDKLISNESDFINTWLLQELKQRSPDLLKGFYKRKYQTCPTPTLVDQVGIEDLLDQAEIGNGSIFSHIYPDKFIFFNQWEEKVENKDFPCYGIILALPDNQPMRTYLVDNKEQLDQISGSNCLILGVVKQKYSPERSINPKPPQVGLSTKTLPYNDPFVQESWKKVVEEMTNGGISKQIGEYYDLDWADFPFLILFKSIRETGIKISFSGMRVEEISHLMNAIFTSIDKAVKKNEDPLLTVKKTVAKKKFVNYAGKTAKVVVVDVLPAILIAILERIIKPS